MTALTIRWLLVLCVVLLVVCEGNLVDGDYQIVWRTMDGGGGTSRGGRS
jgi:hypothetical protein